MKRYRLFIGNGKIHNKHGEYTLYAMDNDREQIITLQCLLNRESFIWDSLKRRVLDKGIYKLQH